MHPFTCAIEQVMEWKMSMHSLHRKRLNNLRIFFKVICEKLSNASHLSGISAAALNNTNRVDVPHLSFIYQKQFEPI